MKRVRLAESMEVAIVATELNLDLVFENMVSAWRGIPYAELSALLGYMCFLSHLHHTHHWMSAGNPAYGDHLLFQRLYEAVQGEIDALGEKSVGLGSISNVDMYTLQVQSAKWTSMIVSDVAGSPVHGSLAQKSLTAELSFIKFSSSLAEKLASQGMLTKGLDNMLSGFDDVHESHIYLLKQRIQGS
jgi:hypothetical protein